MSNRFLKEGSFTVSNEGIFDSITEFFGGKYDNIEAGSKDAIAKVKKTFGNDAWLDEQEFKGGTIHIRSIPFKGDLIKACESSVSEIEKEVDKFNSTALKFCKEVRSNIRTYSWFGIFGNMITDWYQKGVTPSKYAYVPKKIAKLELERTSITALTKRECRAVAQILVECLEVYKDVNEGTEALRDLKSTLFTHKVLTTIQFSFFSIKHLNNYNRGVDALVKMFKDDWVGTKNIDIIVKSLINYLEGSIKIKG